MNLYSVEVFMKAAEIAGITETDAKYVCSLLDGAYDIVYKVPPKYVLTTPEKLVQDVCKCLHVGYKEMLSDVRSKQLAYTRSAIAVLLSKNFPKLTLSEIGKLVNRDHSTIAYYLIENKRSATKQKIYLTVKQKLNI